MSLVASFHAQEDAEIDYSKKGYTKEQIEAMQSASSKQKRSVETLGFIFTKPLTHFKLDNFDYLASLFNNYDKYGNLPFQGPITENPAKVIEIFNIIKALLSEKQSKEEKKLSNKKRR